MKNGFFRLFCVLAATLAVSQLTGCATLFEEGSADDGLAYDRGYGSTASEDDDSPCTGPYCEAKRAPAMEGELNSPLGYEDRRASRAIESRDVVLGMTRQQVMSSWGEPQQREVAGTNATGHERWTYGSRYSLNGNRVVIFENGRVAGWRR
ncbi:MAG: hypothetical protein ACXWQO_12095 [Bdellovibrionota bacterium]